jgi:site-specific DNA-methyltransferase (adenine-specific)
MKLPAPFFQSDHATLYWADAADIVPNLPSRSCDLLLTDPPYGQDWQSNRRAVPLDRLFGDGDTPAERDAIRQVLAASLRTLGQHRHVYVFGPTDVLEGLKVADVVQLVWDKCLMGSGNLTAPWGPSHELIAFTVSKHDHAGKAGRSVLPTRLRKSTILSYPRPTGGNVRHPAEKPVALLRELLESSSRQGEVVLDPYAGSGSTGVAAILTGRSAVLVERDHAYCEMIADRLAAAEAAMADQVRL